MTAAMQWRAVLLGALALCARVSAAQDAPPIQDNSFLVEEAFNQEFGVVQHISTFQRPDGGEAWQYTFTQEWPLGGLRHQLSYTVPVLQADGVGAGVGDILLNYRYQAAGKPGARLWVAPRASLLLPTGSEAKGRGAGELGMQLNLPMSYRLTPEIATHWNAGATAVASGRTTYSLGGSAIWLAPRPFNLMLEALWMTDGAEDAAFLNPGVRWAVDFESGLQIVPGLAYTIGLGPSEGEDGLFLYLSLEHPFRRR